MKTKENSINGMLVVGLLRTQNQLKKIGATRFSEHGLTSTQFSVLELLYHKGPLSIQQIIEQVLSTSGNMTVVVRNLEKGQFIKKRQDMSDQRKWLIELTDLGKEKIEAIMPEHLKDLEALFEGLTEKEKQTLILLLQKIRRGRKK